jgi:hypothetical protein
MLARALAEENGTHTPSAQACRFLNARIASFARAADSESINAVSFRLRRNRCVCRGKDSIEGIEFVCYDFNRFLLSQRLISLWLMLLFPKGSFWDFLGKKVTSSVRIR